MPPRLSQAECDAMIEEIESMRCDMLRLAGDCTDLLADVVPNHRASARNLLHYLALRGRDLRPLQGRLAVAGLSSLGRAESHVLAAVDAVLDALRRLAGRSPANDDAPAELDLDEGQRLLDANTEAALGPRPEGRGVAIMVTMPSEAADDYMLVAQLVRQGMDCMRINCAHDGPDRWARMVTNLKRAVEGSQRGCRISMDLAGPKVRTGEIEPGPAVVKVKPTRDALGRVTEPARVWLFAAEQPQPAPTPADASLPLPGDWIRQLMAGDRLSFVDARGSARKLRVIATAPEGCWAESSKTCYLTPGTTLRSSRPVGDGPEAERRDAQVGTLSSTPTRIGLKAGDQLVVTRPQVAGRCAVRDDRGHILTPAQIGCTAEEIFEDVRTGDRIWFDDGRIGGIVERCEPDRLHVAITRTPAGGASLGAEKGINLPDTVLRIPAITGKDREDLVFAGAHADLVALSFVNSVDDVRELRTLLEPLGERQPAIVLKIETRRGFENLPAMLLEALKAPRCAVMIARGDLAVECGFERLAEVQEEILWLCEAAHVPVIWATQVLETLAKEGLPSRAEVTDAAMSHRAECVMLNKGPYVVEAVQALDDILRRMHGHQVKKTPMMRELGLVSSFRNARASNSRSSS